MRSHTLCRKETVLVRFVLTYDARVREGSYRQAQRAAYERLPFIRRPCLGCIRLPTSRLAQGHLSRWFVVH